MVCHGNRFKENILKITYKGKSITYILDMPLMKVCQFFKIKKNSTYYSSLMWDWSRLFKMGTICYNIIGGEGQRLKLAKELYKQKGNHTLYLLDEPLTGLHPTDVKQLLLLLNRLVEAGKYCNGVEYNSDLTRELDWIIDLGPEGGDAGGEIIAEGTPEEIVTVQASHTGAYLELK
ncbi:hypothetical protein LG329_14310 [Virgibacillus necropolis]|uniref:hypothetical protein n=1 Tax=Virgibacillus necropolis TaxID=163877 RepID=UPI00384E5113